MRVAPEGQALLLAAPNTYAGPARAHGGRVATCRTDACGCARMHRAVSWLLRMQCPVSVHASARAPTHMWTTTGSVRAAPAQAGKTVHVPMQDRTSEPRAVRSRRAQCTHARMH